MTERKPITPREQWVATCRVFLLIGVFCLCHAAYKYDEYTTFEAKPGFKLMLDWSVYVRLYDWGGKWAVVKFILLAAAVFLTASAVAWRKLRKLPRD